MDILNHHELVSRSPLSVTFLGDVQTSRDGQSKYVRIAIDGHKVAYFCNKPAIVSAMDGHSGKQAVLIGEGNDREESGKVTVAVSGTPGEVAEKRKEEAVSQKEQDFRTAKIFFCQQDNLLRMSYAKALKMQMDFPSIQNEDLRAIAIHLSIAAERKGLLEKMPLQALKPDDLGIDLSDTNTPF